MKKRKLQIVRRYYIPWIPDLRCATSGMTEKNMPAMVKDYLLPVVLRPATPEVNNIAAGVKNCGVR